MRKFAPFLVTLLLLIGSLFGLIQIAWLQQISISQTELAIGQGEYRPIHLPFVRNVQGEFHIRMDINPGSSSVRNIRVIPDDRILSLRLNGEFVSLEHISPSDLRNYSRGFEITLKGMRPHENNRLEMTLVNTSGPGGLRVQASQNMGLLEMLLIGGALSVLVFALTRHLPLTRYQYIILAISLILSIVYLSQTNSYTRTYDVYEGGGHRDYIEYLIEHRSLPHPGGGWEYHQPPLYYTIAAVTKAWILNPGSTPVSDFWGQLLALYLWVIFLVASLASLRLAFRKSHLALIFSSMALCLWPSGIIHSIRIGNDIPVFAFYALSFFYCLRWWSGRKFSYLIWAAVWASAAMLTKSNALAVWAVLGCLFLVHAWRTWVRRRSSLQDWHASIKSLFILGAFFISVLTLNLGNNVWHWLEGTTSDWLLSNVSDTINPGLKVANQPVNYLVFDLATFVQEPFISTWDDRYGRQYFWNFVWRSSLSAEFFFQGDGFRVWGIVNGILLLMMLSGIALYLIQNQVLMTPRQKWRAYYRHLPWIFALIFPFILLLAYRIKVPLSCNTDFRYIYPVLLPLLFLSCRVWITFPKRPGVWMLALGTPLIAVSPILIPLFS